MLVADLEKASQNFGNLATIANNLGCPREAVQGLQVAQTLASGAAQFATGNYLGAVASVTSLVGLGAPDAAAERQAAMMEYLDEKFAEINKKLERIIDLQIKTFDAIAELAKAQLQFREGGTRTVRSY